MTTLYSRLSTGRLLRTKHERRFVRRTTTTATMKTTANHTNSHTWYVSGYLCVSASFCDITNVFVRTTPTRRRHRLAPRTVTKDRRQRRRRRRWLQCRRPQTQTPRFWLRKKKSNNYKPRSTCTCSSVAPFMTHEFCRSMLARPKC